MESQKPYPIPSKPKLIILTSLAMTILFTLPRLAAFRFVQNDQQADFRLYDFLARTAYTFIIAVIFLLLNLEDKKISFGFIHVDLKRKYHKVLLNIVLLVISDVILLRLHLFFFDPYLYEKLFRFFFNLNIILEVILVILVAHVYRLLFYNQHIMMINEHLLKVNAETRYEVLMNQINPHFLFNSFNTVNGLINRNKQEAIDFVNNMSDVFRYVLESSKHNLISLQEEMQFIECYTKMLKGRYGNKLEIEVNTSCDATQHMLPPMAVQILIENAVKHNIISARYPLSIKVHQSRDSQLTVSNPLKEKTGVSGSTGMGLSNLNQRFRYLGNREIIIKKTAEEFSVTIPLITADESINY